jgi:integrase
VGELDGTAQERGPHYREILTAAYTGLRLGELLGLQWSSLDLDGGVVRVMSTIEARGREALISEPKTERSRRAVALPAQAVEALRRQRITQSGRRLVVGAAWAG